jgi:hypothetical protein
VEGVVGLPQPARIRLNTITATTRINSFFIICPPNKYLGRLYFIDKRCCYPP